MSISEDHSTVKCYAADTGLLTTLALADSEQTGSNLYRDILLERIEINEGMLAENVVAQLLRVNGHRLFFYSRSIATTRRTAWRSTSSSSNRTRTRQ